MLYLKIVLENVFYFTIFKREKKQQQKVVFDFNFPFNCQKENTETRPDFINEKYVII